VVNDAPKAKKSAGDEDRFVRKPDSESAPENGWAKKISRPEKKFPAGKPLA
jgi:hypothetical protein